MRTENAVVNLAGLVQGITLVTFPAASSILTSPTGYGLSSSQYGAMFLPQVVTAIATSLLGSRLARGVSSKRVLLLGLGANIAAMLVLILTTGFETDTGVAYPLLLLATGFLGAGFGLTVPVLNTYVAAFQPDRVDRAVLVLNALLGLGTALAPVFVAVFVGLGFWWGLPVLSALLLTVLFAVAARLPLRGADATTPTARLSRGPQPRLLREDDRREHDHRRPGSSDPTATSNGHQRPAASQAERAVAHPDPQVTQPPAVAAVLEDEAERRTALARQRSLIGVSW